MKICHASELAMQHAKTFVGGAKVNAAVSMVTRRTSTKGARQCDQQKKLEPFDCKRCGARHESRHLWHKCQGRCHFSKQCFSKEKQGTGKHVHTVDEDDLCHSFFVGMVTRDADNMLEEPRVNRVEQDKWTSGH